MNTDEDYSANCSVSDSTDGLRVMISGLGFYRFNASEKNNDNFGVYQIFINAAILCSFIIF